MTDWTLIRVGLSMMSWHDINVHNSSPNIILTKSMSYLTDMSLLIFVFVLNNEQEVSVKVTAAPCKGNREPLRELMWRDLICV